MRELILEAIKDPSLFEELQNTFPPDLLRAEAIALGKLDELERLYRQYGRKEQGKPVDDRQYITFAGRQYVVVGAGRADLLHPNPKDKESWLRKLSGCDLLFNSEHYPKTGNFFIS